ncbi:hypothetical protein FB451DRAFT_1163998 [Mycena latifolia]|nr:hypothetical protein FB451DRAFT_1163998 [Mycena latifolia]
MTTGYKNQVRYLPDACGHNLHTTDAHVAILGVHTPQHPDLVGIHARYKAPTCFTELPYYALKAGRSHTRWCIELKAACTRPYRPRAPVLPREDSDGFESARGDCQILSEHGCGKIRRPMANGKIQ